jgi:hypothetical protein
MPKRREIILFDKPCWSSARISASRAVRPDRAGLAVPLSSAAARRFGAAAADDPRQRAHRAPPPNDVDRVANRACARHIACDAGLGARDDLAVFFLDRERDDAGRHGATRDLSRELE